MKAFEDLKITRQYLNAMEELGFTEPTPIQKKVIPLAKSGGDIIGIAQTGTGKTAAFLLPIFDRLKCAAGDTPRAIIMVPSRELVMQVVDHAKKMAKYTDFRIMGVFGGKGGLQIQRDELSKGVDIVVGTPGRFMELYFEQYLVLKKVNIMVIDEADRMMDMGFINQIRSILEVVPVKRQNLLFSATFSDHVDRLTHDFLEFPTRIEIAPQSTPIHLVTQRLYRLPNIKSKIYLLEYLLENEQIDKVMVFCRTKLNAETISKYFGRKMEGQVRVLHGNKGQNNRLNAMEAFRNEEIRMLVATDVASRGIDIPEVTHVINFDVPIIPEDYVHRIGRTGRAGKTGVAITFASNPEMYDIKKIEKLIGNHMIMEPTPAGVETEEFFLGEQQNIARELDFQKKKADPTYKGAFHEKKRKIEKRIFGAKKLQNPAGKKKKR